MKLFLTGKRVFISGSGRGIGNTVARVFLEEGARVMINGRNENELLRAYKNLKKKFGARVEYLVGDIADEKTLLVLKKEIRKKWKDIDVIIPNVGSGKKAMNNMLDPREWRRFYEVNTISAVGLIHALLPLMNKRGGAIVLVSSIAGIERTRAPLGYASAKAALLALSKNMSGMLASRRIRVNAILPGNIYFRGGRWEEIINENPEIKKTYIEKEVPLKRFGIPEEIARAIVFLASSASSFTTGAHLVVDGGEMRTL